jgi:hypothetical protein
MKAKDSPPVTSMRCCLTTFTFLMSPPRNELNPPTASAMPQ